MNKHNGLTNDECAHRWAADIDGNDHGKTSNGNIYFERGVIYSYGSHFPIARHVKNAAGNRAVLVTTETSSMTTAMHVSRVRRACHHLRTYHAPLIAKTFQHDLDSGDHAFNVKHFQTVYDAAIERAARIGAAGYMDADRALEYANADRIAGDDYAEFFGTGDCVVPAFKVHLDWIKARYARLTSPEAETKREADREKRAEALRRRHAAQIEEYCAGKIWAHDLDKEAAQSMSATQVERRDVFERAHYANKIEEWAQGAELPRYFSLYGRGKSEAPDLIESRARQLASAEQIIRRDAIDRDRAILRIEAWAIGELDSLDHDTKRFANPEQVERREAFEAIRDREKIEAWRRGESVRFGMSGKVMLRCRPGTRGIETSWGATFPIEDAQIALNYIQIVRKRGKCWQANGTQAPTLGHYRIDRIAADGTVRAGCHSVPWSEIERCAIELGWIAAE